MPPGTSNARQIIIRLRSLANFKMRLLHRVCLTPLPPTTIVDHHDSGLLDLRHIATPIVGPPLGTVAAWGGSGSLSTAMCATLHTATCATLHKFLEKAINCSKSLPDIYIFTITGSSAILDHPPLLALSDK